MEGIEVKPLIDDKLNEIWTNERFKHFIEHPCLAPAEIIPNSILFIGINPSFSENDLKYDYYGLQQENHVVPYFKKMEKIAKKVSESTPINWTHFDLLFNRCTNQKTVENYLNKENGVDYIWQQLQLSKKLLDVSKPKVIVVSNTLARRFLGKDKFINKSGEVINEWLGLDFGNEIDEEMGTYKYNGIPVFFTSMLSGQRAIDNGSYERLIWHIKFVLKQLN